MTDTVALLVIGDGINGVRGASGIEWRFSCFWRNIPNDGAKLITTAISSLFGFRAKSQSAVERGAEGKFTRGSVRV